MAIPKNQEPNVPPEPASSDQATPQPASGKLGGLKSWWHSLPQVSKVGIGAVSAIIVAGLIIILTPLRYPAVGIFHKGTVTLTVVDDETHQPIPDAQAGVGNHADITDKNGNVTLRNLPLGKLTVTVNKHAYASKTIPTTVFWSTRQLGQIAIHSTGVLVKFGVSDWVSSKPLTAAKVTIGNSSAVTDGTGMASVSLEPQALAGAKATIALDGFNSQTVPVNQAVSKLNAVTMVPAGTVYFLSNRSGRIDLYSSLVDGSSQTIVLKGSGSEDSATGLLPSINDQNSLAIVSSRAGKHDSFGNLQHDLYLFTGGSNKLTQIDSNVQFTDFRAWVGASLVWVKSDTTGVSVKSYDIKTNTAHTLATIPAPTDANSYLSIGGLGVYGQTLYYNLNSSDANLTGFYSIGLSSAPKRLDPGAVDQAYRTAKDSLVVSLSAPGAGSPTWKKLTFASGAFSTLPGEPADESNRGYADSPDGRHSSYIETRDGKTQLYLTDANGSNDTAITTSGSVNQFVQWYGNSYIAYSTNDKASSVYIVSINGGTEKKITDFFQGNGKSYGGGYNPNYF